MSIKQNGCTSVALAALLLAGAGLPALAAPAGPQATAGTSASAASASQDAFNRNMQTMRAQMQQLHATSDRSARAKLLEEHMRTMQATMPMMMGQGGMAQGGGMGPGMMRGGMGGPMMGNGQMMQMMMGQMMQHQQAMRAMGCMQ